MRHWRRCAILSATVLTVLPSAIFAAAPPARADCLDSDGIALCDDGDSSGTTGSRGPWYPSPCEDDFTCVNGASVFGDDNGGDEPIAGPPQPPGRPDIGLPGRPGDRPDRPDRPNRPGGGGGTDGGS